MIFQLFNCEYISLKLPKRVIIYFFCNQIYGTHPLLQINTEKIILGKFNAFNYRIYYDFHNTDFLQKSGIKGSISENAQGYSSGTLLNIQQETLSYQKKQ